MELIALFLLAVSIGAYSISQLQQHGKLMFDSPFWDASSWKLKYKIEWIKCRDGNLPDLGQFTLAPNNWYYRLFKIKYKERFPLSATFLVALTDGYHLTQSISFLSLAGCISLLSGINFLYLWLGILFCNFLTYRALQR